MSYYTLYSPFSSSRPLAGALKTRNFQIGSCLRRPRNSENSYEEHGEATDIFTCQLGAIVQRSSCTQRFPRLSPSNCNNSSSGHESLARLHLPITLIGNQTMW